MMYSSMMTSSNGNIFRVTGHLCGEFAGELPTQRPVTRSFDVFFVLRLNKRLSKQSWGWWFETQSCPLWRHRNGIGYKLRWWKWRPNILKDCAVIWPGWVHYFPPKSQICVAEGCHHWFIGTKQATHHYLNQWWLLTNHNPGKRHGWKNI